MLVGEIFQIKLQRNLAMIRQLPRVAGGGVEDGIAWAGDQITRGIDAERPPVGPVDCAETNGSTRQWALGEIITNPKIGRVLCGCPTNCGRCRSLFV